jgi:GGDEF domain-containing protein
VHDRQLAASSNIDDLTGLLRQNAFISLVLRKFLSNSVFSLMMLDLDDFKMVNDKCGHIQGDKILSAVSHVISDTVRTNVSLGLDDGNKRPETNGLGPVDFVGRWGGEEISILLPNTEFEGARVVADRILAALKASDRVKDILNPYRYNLGRNDQTLSGGIVAYSPQARPAIEQIFGTMTDDNAVSTIVKIADHWLYQAKDAGKNRILPYSEDDMFSYPIT